jgi:raffinose/stachyose/melibiose transport system substrate-binding protein
MKAPAVDASGNVVLKVMAFGDNSTPEGQTWDEFVKDFQAANPGIVIQSEMLYNDPYHQKLKARIAAGDIPDIAYLWSGSRSQYFYDAGLGVDLFKIKGFDKTKYSATTMVPQGPKGELFEVPLTFGVTSVLFMNTEMLAKYKLQEPKTYEDLVKMVSVLKKDNISVISFAGSEAWVWNSCLLGTLVARTTGDAHWISDAVAGKHKFTDKPFVDALALIDRMVKDGVLPATTSQTDYGTSIGNFVNGKALFTLDGHWRAGAIEDPAFQAKVKMISFPKVPGENAKGAGLLSGEATPGYGLSVAATRDPKVLDAAVKFINYFNGEKWELRRLKDSGFLPALKVALPADTPVLAVEKGRFYGTLTQVSDIPDSFITGKAVDSLNAGMQKIALGLAKPADVAAQLEKDVRAK